MPNWKLAVPTAELCRLCGQKNNVGHYALGDTVKDESICFTCNYWTGVVTDEKGITIVIDGWAYLDSGYVQTSNTRGLGFGGREFRIVQGGTVWMTNNLCCRGKIPDHFRAQLPDNATFFTHKVWVDIHGQLCLADVNEPPECLIKIKTEPPPSSGLPSQSS